MSSAEPGYFGLELRTIPDDGDARQRRSDRLCAGALDTGRVHTRGVVDSELSHVLARLLVPARRGVAENREKIRLVVLA